MLKLFGRVLLGLAMLVVRSRCRTAGRTALVDDSAEFLAELNTRVQPLVAGLPAIETPRTNPGR